MKELKVIELFAGVGGFRLGLEGWKGKSASSGYKKKLNSNFKVVWSNQWEPSTKAQHASDVYATRWGSEYHSNADISTVPIEDIPDHDVLVGGFPATDVVVVNAQTVTATTPISFITGFVNITLNFSGGSVTSLTRPSCFEYVTCFLDGFSPSSGSASGGQTVLINGRGV